MKPQINQNRNRKFTKNMKLINKKMSNKKETVDSCIQTLSATCYSMWSLNLWNFKKGSRNNWILITKEHRQNFYHSIVY